MHITSLELLVCPVCRDTLEFKGQETGGWIAAGSLDCAACQRSYPIQDGMPHFATPAELSGSNRGAARMYNRLAPLYPLFLKFALLPFGGVQKAGREILAHLEPGSNRVLEVSIGTGANLPRLLELPGVEQIFGLDISGGMLSRCRRRVDRQGWPVELFQGMGEALPFKDNSFDQVLHIGGINFFSDRGLALVEMLRVARPGSKIVVADEAERFAGRPASTRTAESRATDPQEPGGDLLRLLPLEVDERQAHGIWQLHGRAHGYLLAFRKPA